VLVKGLSDPLPTRRAAVGFLLARTGGAEPRAEVRRLLEDRNKQVRQQVAEGLVGAANLGDEVTEADEALLKANGIPNDAAGLAAFFRKRSLTPRDRKHLVDLVQQLGDRSYRKRQQASEDLVKAGSPALRYLNPALKDANLENARRAAQCIARIERGPGTALPMAAVRSLVKLAPPDAVKVLLGYIPSADDEIVEKTVLAGLCALAVRKAALDPAFAATLTDPEPARRAAAGYVLGRAGLAKDCEAVRRLLRDTDPRVRLQAAQGLVHAQDKTAVPVLVGLLERDQDRLLHGPAEEVLRRLARDDAPAISVSADSATERRKARDAWAAWWRDHGKDADLARLSWDAGQRGLTVVCEFDGSLNNRGKAYEFGRDLQPRWVIDELQGPMDVHVVPGGKVLVVEATGQRVSERDLKGKILWQVEVSGQPVACQRLDDGHTLIATQSNLIEIDGDQDEVYNHNREDDGLITSAHKAPNGHIVYITDLGWVVEFDPHRDGRVVYRFNVGDPGGPCGVEWLPNGRYLVALSGPGKVMEVDRSGKPVWSMKVAGAHQALRLPSGRLLVVSMSAKRVAEMDRTGKVFWEKKTRGRPWRVHRR
jgi:hypothetical protein